MPFAYALKAMCSGVLAPEIAADLAAVMKGDCDWGRLPERCDCQRAYESALPVIQFRVV